MGSNTVTESDHWYILCAKFKQEKRAAQELSQQNIVVFLPLYRYERIIRGKKIIKEEPLFSRYLFVRLNDENTNWTSVRSTRGISNFVEFGKGPAIVAQTIIDELKKIDILPPEPYLKTGEKVRIIDGSLKGLRAIYQVPDSSTRSYILLAFMQQNQYVRIDNQLLEKI